MRTPFGIDVHVWTKAAAVALSAMVLVAILRRLDAPQLWQSLQQARIGWVITANLVLALGYFFSAIRWHLVLGLDRMQVHSGATLRLTFLGPFLNTLFLGAAGGDVVKSALYSRWFERPMATVLATCALDRSLGGIGFLILTGMAFLLALTAGKPLSILPSSAFSAKHWLIVAVLSAAVLAMIAFRKRLRRNSPVLRFSDAFRSQCKQLWAAPRLAWRGIAFGFLTGLCGCALLLLCLKAVAQRPLPLLELIWVFPVIGVLASAPVAFAGTGLREGSALVLLGLYGIEATEAVGAALLVSGIYVLWFIIGGLVLWQTSRSHTRQAQRTEVKNLSAVIPTLNEADALEATVRHLQRIPEVTEIIVADGGSTDATREIAMKLDCRVVQSARGRGLQMQTGAAAARGDVVMLVHADTWLPENAGRAILNCLHDATVVGGGFWKSFRDPSPLMRGSRVRCAVRLFLAGRVMGDQAIFVRRDVLERIGGVPDWPLMEEFELCRGLRKAGRLALAGATVTTSARRFAKLGVLRTYARMWRVTLQYYLGVPAHKLQRTYEKE